MTYQLPTDADGVKYHGREYDDKGGIIAAGVDEHGNDKPILINTDGSLNMQSVVQELHDIKQRQQEILERLDDPIDTRVTGSNVEEVVAENVTVSGGSSTAVGSVDLSGFNSFSISARAATVHNFDLSIRFAFFDNNDTLDNSSIDVDYASKGNGVSIRLLSKRIDALGQRVRISIVNNTTTDQDYRWVRVYKYV